MNAKINFTRIFLAISIILGIFAFALNDASNIYGIVIAMFCVSLIICAVLFLNISQEAINNVLMIDFFKKIGIDIDND